MPSFSRSAPRCPSPNPPQQPRRVLYPASQSRRPCVKEAPDQAQRWLLLLSALVLLQIYTEEPQTCTELQNQCPDPVTCPPSDDDGPAQEWRGEEPCTLETAAPQHQLECVVV